MRSFFSQNEKRSAQVQFWVCGDFTRGAEPENVRVVSASIFESNKRLSCCGATCEIVVTFALLGAVAQSPLLKSAASISSEKLTSPSARSTARA